MTKRLLCPHRLRRVPPQFSWVDQRLLREGHLPRCGPAAWALYLLLVTACDAQGLSYYSEKSIGRLLSLSESDLRAARRSLVAAGLIAYEAPLYQVLSLVGAEAARTAPAPAERMGEALPFAEILRQMLSQKEPPPASGAKP